MRWTGGGACTGDYAASLGKVPLPVAKLTGRVSGLASLATRLGLDLDTLYLLQTAVQSEREGGVESVEELRSACTTGPSVRTSYHKR